MTITNHTTLKAVTLLALVATDDPRWHRAIRKAARWLVAGNTPRRLPNGHMVIASATDAELCYTVNGVCTCRQATHGAGICWHRACARLWERYQKAEQLRHRYTYEGRELAYTTTPGGEAVLEDAQTQRCFSVAAIRQDPDLNGSVLDQVQVQIAALAA